MAAACLDLTYAPYLCANCRTTCGLRRCGGCYVVHYCGKECQRTDRAHHKELCKAVASGRIATRNPKAYKQNTTVTQVFNHVEGLGMLVDAHAWHVSQAPLTCAQGEVPIGSLAYAHFLGQLNVHKRYGAELQGDVKNHPEYKERKERWEVKLRQFVGDDLFDRGCTSDILECYETFGTGFDRAWYLMMRWPEVYDEGTLRIGSLGRRTHGGGMFWELG